MRDALRGYLAMANGLTEVPRRRAAEAAKALLAQGEATAEQVGQLTDELLATSRSNREALSNLVRYEIDRTLSQMGLVTADKHRALAARVATLEAQARAGSRGDGGAEPARKAPAKKVAAKKAAKTTPTKTTPTKTTPTDDAHQDDAHQDDAHQDDAHQDDARQEGHQEDAGQESAGQKGCEEERRSRGQQMTAGLPEQPAPRVAEAADLAAPGDQAGSPESEAAPSTGDPRVDTATSSLTELDDLPISQHAAQYAEVHTQLQDILNAVDSPTGAAD